jgi:hypothetical protein
MNLDDEESRESILGYARNSSWNLSRYEHFEVATTFLTGRR